MTHTRCVFCGKPFIAAKRFSRTCYACSAQGAPDQAEMVWADYERRARVWQAERDPLKAEKLRQGYKASGLAGVPILASLPLRTRKPYSKTPKRSGAKIGTEEAK